MIGVAVVGYGYWGPNLVRNFCETPGVRLVSVCDLRPERLAAMQARYPSVEITDDFEKLTGDKPQSLKDFLSVHKAALTA